MKNFTKFVLTMVVGIIALILRFILHLDNWSAGLIIVAGSIIALSMFVDMIKTLRNGQYGVDLLAITAIVATLAVGEYFASLIILIMLTGGDSLEDYARTKASGDLTELLNNAPQMAHKIVGEEIQDLPVEKIIVGDIVSVRPLEVVPVDGVVFSGESTFDESSLTGEARPIEKKVGDELLSGTLNGEAAVTMKVTATSDNSQYQSIVKLVKEANSQPAHFVRMADRYAVPFTIVSFLIAGLAWAISGDPTRFAQVLVVASPCPLILAAPIALVAGLSRASRNQIVIKNGTALEKLAQSKTMAFDKTGTLTKGVLQVAEIIPVSPVTEEELLCYAASAEQNSNHVLAHSLLNHFSRVVPAENVSEIPGVGVEATVLDKKVKVGKASFTNAPKQEDATAIYISFDDQFVGAITFSDELRPEAAGVLKNIHEAGLETVMLTGDHQAQAELIAGKIGLAPENVHAQLLPQEKLNFLKNLPAEKHPVAMVGDGINDAPALALADVGIAMGKHGATAASESADAVVLADSLEPVAEAVKISKRTMVIARQSVLIGIAICIILEIIAAFGFIPTLVGAFLQEGIDTISILSALRALYDKKTK
ncbi:heavy metal translocating P-type ATPase [Enterococcus timonensis]|uniref:heavy metal translocating P-type ATPase n=1 Tax=Enterococcus timonensis TaxID=1852364 RepID=UPI0008D8E864|nr:heavy metal translocating P-type ATPase [Enterococcus timonensis]